MEWIDRRSRRIALRSFTACISRLRAGKALWRVRVVGRAVYCIGLENRRRRESSGGSNPSPPAIHLEAILLAKITTSTGEEIAFDPAAITAVAERDAGTGEACTTVYGLSAAPLRIGELARALLTRLQLSKRFAKLTPGVRTGVVAGLLTQGVEETPEEASTRVDEAHANLRRRGSVNAASTPAMQPVAHAGERHDPLDSTRR